MAFRLHGVADIAPLYTIILSLLLVVLGCAHAQPMPDDALLKTWQSKSKDELVAVFGPPTRETQSAQQGCQ